MIWSTIYKYRAEGLKRDSMPEHLKLYEAVAARDTGAAITATEELIDLALSDTTEAMGPQRPRRRKR